MTKVSLSSRININTLPKDGTELNLLADAEQLGKLSAEVIADEMLGVSALLTVRPWKMKGAVLSGIVKAQVHQMCSVTLEPMTSAVEFDFKRFFLPASDPAFGMEPVIDGELIIDPEGDDLPDILEDGHIDLRNVIVEELNLNIDPYPRATGAEFAEKLEDTESSDTHRPFADLKTLITEKKPRN
ncbi:MAG: DUF177 domain-containing protein [Pseudomonadota bacterium]